MKIEREVIIKEKVLEILDISCKHYQLTRSNLIELLFIISIDRDIAKTINNIELIKLEEKKTKTIFIRISEENLDNFYEVAKYYKKSLSQYIELLILSNQLNGRITL